MSDVPVFEEWMYDYAGKWILSGCLLILRGRVSCVMYRIMAGSPMTTHCSWNPKVWTSEKKTSIIRLSSVHKGSERGKRKKLLLFIQQTEHIELRRISMTQNISIDMFHSICLMEWAIFFTEPPIRCQLLFCIFFIAMQNIVVSSGSETLYLKLVYRELRRVDMVS